MLKLTKWKLRRRVRNLMIALGLQPVLARLQRERPLLGDERLESAPPLVLDWPAGVAKPKVGLVKDSGDHPYWPKYERFLQVNSIPYELFDIHRSDFLDRARQFDLIVWRPDSSYGGQWEAKAKIELLNRYLGIATYPSKDELWFYEDKNKEFWLLGRAGVPAVTTFISYSRAETESFLEQCSYPLVSKDITNSASQGVKLLRTQRQALKFARQVFTVGARLHYLYVRQYGYVHLQEYLPNPGYDLRVICVGNSYFGYYRYAEPGDFRASGAGRVVKQALPPAALELARQAKQALPPTRCLAVDMVQDIRSGQFYIIECSIFINVLSSVQLMVEGVPGRYIEQEGQFVFAPGKFWLQELTLAEVMKDWIQGHGGSRIR